MSILNSPGHPGSFSTVRFPLLGFLLLLVLAGPIGAAQEASPGVVSLPTDFAPLKTTLMLSVGDNIFKSTEMGSGSHPVFRSGLPRGAIEEHAALVRLLESQGIQILRVRDLLNGAVEESRKKGTLASWLRRVFPATADEAIQRIDELSGDSILNLRDEHFYVETDQGLLNPLFPGLSSMYWSRDFAISTPHGIVIGNSRHYGRVLERELARFMFENAPELVPFPVVFDAEKEGVFLDGGDLIVRDEKTLLLGVENRSNREAAEKLARKLNMDVLAVALPSSESPGGLRGQLLHLDSIFNIVDSRTVLAVPYFLEQGADQHNPMRQVLLGMARQLREISQKQPEHRLGDPKIVEGAAEHISEVGWVTRYRAGSGEPEDLKVKLVDLFRKDGFRVIYVGGTAGHDPEVKYALERAMYELRWQGANVVQLAPGRVVAYEHNIHTNQALREAGIEVLTFPGELLSMRNGGPHCLLMPLVRGPLP